MIGTCSKPEPGDHVRLLFHIAHRLRCRFPRYDADELASIGFTGLHKACDTFDPMRGVPFQAYAAKLIHYTVCNHMRRDRHHIPLEVLRDEDLARMEPEGLRDDMASALDQLGAEERQVIDGIIAGQTLDEIARELRHSPQWVARYRDYAFDHLRIILKDYK